MCTLDQPVGEDEGDCVDKAEGDSLEWNNYQMENDFEDSSVKRKR